MFEFLKLPFMVQALIGCLLLASTLSYFGIHVVLRRIVFVDLALAQVSSVGVAVAMLLEKNVTVFALIFTLLGAALLSVRIREKKIPQEAVIGIVYAAASAVAILLVAKTPHGEADVMKILFGNILAVTKAQLIEMAGVFGLVGVIQFIFRKRMFAITADHEKARKEGSSLVLWDLLFYLSLGLIIAFAIKSAGVLLVFSFLIAPGIFSVASGKSSLSTLYAFAFGFGAVSSIVGLYVSYSLDLPTGATIISTFGALLLGAGIIRSLRGN